MGMNVVLFSLLSDTRVRLGQLRGRVEAAEQRAGVAVGLAERALVEGRVYLDKTVEWMGDLKAGK